MYPRMLGLPQALIPVELAMFLHVVTNVSTLACSRFIILGP